MSIGSVIFISDHIFNNSNDFQPIDNFAEYNMFPIKMRARHQSDEKLRAISIWAGICH